MPKINFNKLTPLFEAGEDFSNRIPIQEKHGVFFTQRDLLFEKQICIFKTGKTVRLRYYG